MTKAEAKQLYASKFWESMTDGEKVTFQLFEERLCMPFSVFHAAVEKCLKRSVWTHEFANPDHLRREFLGDRPAPTMQEIINLIPASKRILITLPDQRCCHD